MLVRSWNSWKIISSSSMLLFLSWSTTVWENVWREV